MILTRLYQNEKVESVVLGGVETLSEFAPNTIYEGVEKWKV